MAGGKSGEDQVGEKSGSAGGRGAIGDAKVGPFAGVERLRKVDA